MSNTTLWHIHLIESNTPGKYYVFVSKGEAEGAYRTWKFRAITAKAAARRFIKHTLPSVVIKMDDGFNEEKISQYVKDKQYTKSCYRYFMEHNDRGIRIEYDKS